MVLFILAGQLGSAQFRDIYNKAVKKAQGRINQTINGTATASGPAPNTPSPNADLSGDTGTTTLPLSASSKLSSYDFCGMMVGHIKYYSEVFTLPIEAAHLSASPAIVSVLPLQFRTYLTQKYGAQAMRGGTGCSGGWETEEVAKEQKRRDQIGFQSLNLPDSKIVETDSRYVEGPGATTNAPPAGAGAVGYCIFTISDKVAHTVSEYVSSIFPATQDLTNGDLAQTYLLFISANFRVRTKGKGAGANCSRFKSQAKAQQDMNIQRHSLTTLKWVETGWTPSRPSAEANSGSSLDEERGSKAALRDSKPAATPDTTPAIELEYRGAPDWCEHRAGMQLSGNYDCHCIGEKVHEYRLAHQTTYAKAMGGRLVLDPPIGEVLNDADLRSCASPIKITSYVSKNLLDTFAYGTPPAQQQAMASCVSQKMVAHLKSDPHGLETIDKYNRQDVSDCNLAIVIGK